MATLKGTMLTALGVLALTVPAAAGGTSWLHIKVDEAGNKAATVRVNLPLTVLEAVAPLAGEEFAKNTKIHAGDKRLNKAELKRMLIAVRDTDDAEFVRVQDDGDDVRVAKVKGQLVVHVREKGKAKDTVSVQIPMEVADALLNGPGDELDFVAALNVLKQRGSGPLVTVDDDDSKVRIWIDDRNGTE
jgi:hypothetical protein